MRYLSLYYDFLKKVDKKRSELGEYLAAKEESNSFEIIHTEELKKKLYNAILVSDILLMIFAGVFYSFFKEYYEVSYMIYYFIFALLVNIGLVIAIFIFKFKINKLKDRSNTLEALKLKEEYRIQCEKIFDICPLIIILNDYYYELKPLSKEEGLEFYKNKLSEIQKNIGFVYKNQNVQAYQEYFENWLSKKQE